MEMKYEDFWQSLLHDVPFTVTRNKNRKSVTVTIKSNPPIKIIATYQQWADLYNKFCYSEDSFSFSDVEPYVKSATSKSLLKKLYEDDRHTFLNLIYHYAIEPALSLNPLYKPARKERGGNPLRLTRLQMEEIRRLARWIYAYLRVHKKCKKIDAVKKTMELLKINIDEESFYNHFIANKSLDSIQRAVKNKKLAENRIKTLLKQIPPP